jgi:hypothetical protein
MSVLTRAMWHNIPEDGFLQQKYQYDNAAGKSK